MATSPNLRCQLSEWGLPPLIIAWFKKKGITSLFEWQVECLCKNDVLFGGNLVYTAPTSAGKTLVADFLLLKKVLEGAKKALVIEPFVALTREKATTLKSMLYSTKARVGTFGGNYYTPGGMTAVSVAVCTIEKANNFVNKMINENKLSELGIIVVDEIHYLGDDSRGYQLELLLTKVLYYNSSQDKHKRIQIVGLSATVPNLESIAVWLKASLYVTHYRPVPLVEKIKLGDKVYEVNSFLRDPSCKPLEVISKDKIYIEKDYDDLCYLCIDSVVDGHSTLVFCESKRECEVMASLLAAQIKVAGNKLNCDNQAYSETSRKIRNNLSRAKILDLLDKLKKCPAGVDKELLKSLSFGVAFHHAGLTTEEREIIEDGFRGGAIKVLLATSTLSSGVNLPARRVIIRSPTMVYTYNSSYQKEMLNPITYRQMIGRAGRKNIDTSGESILICTEENRGFAMKLIKASIGNINSSLSHRMLGSEGEPSGLKKAILEVIANNTAKTRVNLDQYLQSTYWLSEALKEQDEEFFSKVTETLRYLISQKFIEELKPGLYKPTRLGNAVLASGLHPDESLELVQDLSKARKGFCLLNDLHIIFQVTPSDIYRTVELKDWQHYSKIWNDLDEVCRSVGELVGIDEVTLARRCQGFMSAMNTEKERVYRRFWVALVINDLISEISLPKICSKYRMNKATVQLSQRAVARFAGVISLFCQELGYENIAALVRPLESRINFSCQRDLLDLIKLNITRPIARALFNAGYKNVIAVAKGDKLDIEFVIRQTRPFKKDASFNIDSQSTPSMWVPELAKTLTILDYASHIVDLARSHVEIEYEIDLTPAVEKRKDNPTTTNGQAAPGSPPKRSRTENAADPDASTEVEDTNNPTDLENMPPSRRRLSNFEVEYLGRTSKDVDDFLENWIVHSSVSLNFKLEEVVSSDDIGIRVRRPRRGSSRRRTQEPDENANVDGQIGSQERDGLELPLEVENKKHVVTRMYAAFGDSMTVFVVDNRQAMLIIRDKLRHYLDKSYSSARARTATQAREDFIPIKLYTKDIISTYKILYAAFNIDQSTLNRHFEWHSFDVAWWMISYCCNRGRNNVNQSLSLVTKTKWAKKYHHFLFPDSKRSSRAMRRSLADAQKFKDVVKSGKTAILQPLINEILAELEQRNQMSAYHDAEIPSRLTMAQVMVHGIGLETKCIKKELELYEKLSDQLTDIAQEYANGVEISLTNVRDVARVLYVDLDLKKHLFERSTNSDISKDPTNAEILSILSDHHPFPRLVQDFRRIAKALDALQSLNTHARYNEELNMMRVFGQCDFWQTTGRISMTDPDLFLINRNFSVTIPAHSRYCIEHEEQIVQCAPRRCFVPCPGWIYVAADYSQLELRLLSHFANEENLLSILNRDPKLDDTFDVFKTTAARIYKIPVEEVTSEDRQRAKQICYGIIYGMGNRTLANLLNVDIEKAEEFRKDFFNAFPRILAYIDELVADCEILGYVKSLLGRRRLIDGINSESSYFKSKARRVAISTRIQSSASDIIKLAMRRLNEKILEHFKGNARLVLEMHDELIYELNPTFLDRFSRTLQFIMEEIASTEDLRVKLLVNLKKGTDWSNLEKFETT